MGPRLDQVSSSESISAQLRKVADHIRKSFPFLAFDEDDAELGVQQDIERETERSITLLEAIAVTVDSKLAPEELMQKHPAAHLIECVRAAHVLTSARHLEFVALRSLSIACPPLLCAAMTKRVTEGKLMIKKTTMYRARLMFDLAFALYM